MRRKKAYLLIAGLVVLLVLLSVAIASGSATRPTAPRPAGKVRGNTHALDKAAAARAAAEPRHRVRRRVDRTLLKHFRLLRQARAGHSAHATSGSSETTVAAALAGLETLHATHGADPTQAAETTIGLANDPVWIVPGSTGACLVDVDGPGVTGSGCNSTSEADSGEMWTLDTIPYGVAGAQAKVLIGAVPDRNSSVTVTWADGSTTVVPVTNNLYSVPIGSHTGWKSVTLRNSAGAVVSASGMPQLP